MIEEEFLRINDPERPDYILTEAMAIIASYTEYLAIPENAFIRLEENRRSSSFNLDNLSIQAVLRSLQCVEYREHREGLDEFLRSPEEFISNSPEISQRIMTRILREYNQVHRGTGEVEMKGAIEDPHSNLIFGNYQSSAKFWFHPGTGPHRHTEFLVTVGNKPDGKMLNHGYDSKNYLVRNLLNLKDEGKLTGKPFEFIIPLGYGFFVPVQGMTEVTYFDRHNFSQTITCEGEVIANKYERADHFYSEVSLFKEAEQEIYPEIDN